MYDRYDDIMYLLHNLVKQAANLLLSLIFSISIEWLYTFELINHKTILNNHELYLDVL